MKLFRQLIKFLASPTTVFYFFLATLAVPNVILSITEQLTVWGQLANVILPVGVYYLLMTISRRVGVTVLCMFPFAFFAAFQLVLLYLYGRSVIAVDMFLNLVTTNAGEVGELLGNLMFIIVVVIVLYLPPIVWSIISLSRHGSQQLDQRWIKVNRTVAAIMTFIGLVLTTGCCLFDENYSLKRDMYPINVAYNLSLAVDRTVTFNDYDSNVRDYSFSATSTHDPLQREIYVLVVGETSRAANWQLLGYDRQTNPKLSTRDNVIAFSRALSESNTTHKSVPMLLSHLDASNFNDSINHVKSIVTAFKEAGFATAFFSNQRPNHSYIDKFIAEADTSLFIRENPGTIDTSDLNLIPFIDKIIALNNPKQLIVIHTYGSHFNYYDRYSHNHAKFLPDNSTEATPENRDQLINAYDNSIVATDDLLDAIIERLSKVDNATTAMVYTSDHGEDIYDDDRQLFLHASPCPSINQIHVPFIVWTSAQYNELYPTVRENLSANSNKNMSSSQSFFNTSLEIAGISTPVLNKNSSVASASFKPGERRYLNDHNQSVDLYRAGFQQTDLDEMKRRQLDR